jgi:hypothetical protein
MTGLLFAAVVLITAAVWVTRGLRTRRARAATRSGPGTSPAAALAVTSFDQIDRMVAARRCHCGAGVRPTGEGTREAGERRFRYVRLECDACEDEQMLFFDVTAIFH